jgi:hypothetical protein
MQQCANTDHQKCSFCIGPAGGSGFTELAGYIFGGNSQGLKMEMTTPVFTRTGDATTTTSSSSSSSSSGGSGNGGSAYNAFGRSGTSSSGSSSGVPMYNDPNTSRMQFMLEKRFAGEEVFLWKFSWFLFLEAFLELGLFEGSVGWHWIW